MNWVAFVIFGAILNVAINYGYKITTGQISVEWLVAGTLMIASITMLSFSVVTRRTGWRNLTKGITPFAMIAIGLTIAGCFICFVTALSKGPISLVDPLWACIYSIASLFIGAIIIKERPSIGALAGIGLYLAGAAFMGFSGYNSAEAAGKIWVIFALVGAIANACINFGFKVFAPKIDMFIMVGVAYLFAVMGLVAYGLYNSPAGWVGIGVGNNLIIMVAMGVLTPCFAGMLIIALLRGPISIVDPLWACVYALASIAIGMIAAGETPTTTALAGIGLYLIGAILMGYHSAKQGKIKAVESSE